MYGAHGVSDKPSSQPTPRAAATAMSTWQTLQHSKTAKPDETYISSNGNSTATGSSLETRHDTPSEKLSLPESTYRELKRKRLVLNNMEIIEAYRSAMAQIDMQRYANDLNNLYIWLDFLNLQREVGAGDSVASKFYDKMYSFKLGRKLAYFYCSWSDFLVSIGESEKGISVVALGEKEHAEPLDMLKQQKLKLEGRAEVPKRLIIDHMEKENRPVSVSSDRKPARSRLARMLLFNVMTL